MFVVERVHPDGAKVTDEIIGIGQTGIVIKQGEHAVKIPRLTRILEIDGVPVQSGRMTPEEGSGSVDERPIFIQTLQKEKAIYRRLSNHSGIIQCLNLSSDHYSIQMPLMQSDLKNYLRKNLPDKQRKLSWLKEMASTLSYIHSRCVIIGDYRLDNIMLDDQMNTKLIDFSESTLMPLDWDLQGADEWGFSVLTDIGQFGVAMLEMITGQHCEFDTLRDWDTVGATWPGRDTLPSTNGVWLGHIIEKCWTRGYTSAAELAEDLSKEG
ncbi:putative serine threonine protein kinase [Phaeomoniella chlamydospora]|uniref:Putative serine threonine protein kinase n=1 Tax=Phaeomoniella chlamydospora TaxID=158046 RepID=A0A0G2G4F6_PHACM|nr:putative serine threonine protein kinase [Phaeomoniella chlamydospora]